MRTSLLFPIFLSLGECVWLFRLVQSKAIFSRSARCGSVAISECEICEFWKVLYCFIGDLVKRWL